MPVKRGNTLLFTDIIARSHVMSVKSSPEKFAKIAYKKKNVCLECVLYRDWQNVKSKFVFLQTFPLQGWTLFEENMVCSLHSLHRTVGCRWSLSCRLLSVTCPHLQWHSPCLGGKVVSCTKHIHSKCKSKQVLYKLKYMYLFAWFTIFKVNFSLHGPKFLKWTFLSMVHN